MAYKLNVTEHADELLDSIQSAETHILPRKDIVRQ